MPPPAHAGLWMIGTSPQSEAKRGHLMTGIQFLRGASLGWKAIKYMANSTNRQKAKMDRE